MEKLPLLEGVAAYNIETILAAQNLTSSYKNHNEYDYYITRTGLVAGDKTTADMIAKILIDNKISFTVDSNIFTIQDFKP